MNKRSICLAPIVGIATLCLAQDSFGQVLLDNYPSNNGAASSISATGWQGIHFTTPSEAVNVDSVTLRLINFTSADNPLVGFYADDGGVPSATPIANGVLLDAPVNGSNATISDSQFLPSGTLTLAPNTTYWLVAKSESASGFYSWIGSNPGVLPTGSATDVSYSSFNGTTWNSSTTFNTVNVSVTPVPEPAHFTLIGAGALVGFAALRRKLKR